MKIKALGAVGTVTGSSFRLELADGAKVLLDCGLFQGGRQTELRNANTGLYEPAALAALILTHAHMDHSGLAPRLVKAGFRGPIHATAATCDLLKVLWLDAAHIQEQEAVWKSRKNQRQGQRGVEPLYREEDARRAMTLLQPLSFNADREIIPGLTLRLTPAGHILGAAGAHFTALENGRARRVAFSGDLGRSSQLLMPEPAVPPSADTLFMETTYGNRRHKDMGPSVEELLAAIDAAWREKGKILIPAFAVERTQEIILLLARAWHEGRLPRELPIILDSPLASAALSVYSDHQELFDRDSRAFLNQWGQDRSRLLPTLRLTKSAQESQALNDIPGSALIIAGSGMANAGRILHHLKHNLWRPNCHVIFVGFQAQGTTGRRLVEGGKVVKIFREAVNVEARIHTIGGFSGHADQSELLAWLGRLAHPGLTVNLIHGEAAGTRDFYELARRTFPEVHFHIPTWLSYAAPAEEPATAAGPPPETAPAPRPEDQAVAASLGNRLDRLRDRATAAGALPPAQLALLEKYLEQAENLLLAAPATDL
ncbi:MAG: MBL fold metallo-hydrolase [Candidatus Adiutrix sp.]|jgi:metallo-beta-lactamase family protein|nr:MBL fold metallo-hydrolase [Candidatus Adiutrix sp.]